jgi:hypothetical protein
MLSTRSEAVTNNPHDMPVDAKGKATCNNTGNSTPSRQPLFHLGRAVITPEAKEALTAAQQSPFTFLRRHVTGDWGDVSAADRRANIQALSDESRLLSAYTLVTEVRIWVITEADRSVTTILLPSDY